MDDACRPRRILLETRSEKGTVTIVQDPCTDEISRAVMDKGLGAFFRYGVQSRERTRDIIRETVVDPDDIPIVLFHKNVIIGYINIIRPAQNERWGRLRDDRVLELASIEISRGWRGLGLARTLLDSVFWQVFFDDKVTFTQEYAWHWDLEGADVDKWTYRDRLSLLLIRYGFNDQATDEPNINFDPANMLMVRFGRKVDDRLKFSFLDLLYADKKPYW